MSDQPRLDHIRTVVRNYEHFAECASALKDALVEIERLRVEDGMTIRDWFAAMATADDVMEFWPTSEESERFNLSSRREDWTFARYRYADAMLAERNRNERP